MLSSPLAPAMMNTESVFYKRQSKTERKGGTERTEKLNHLFNPHHHFLWTPPRPPPFFPPPNPKTPLSPTQKKGTKNLVFTRSKTHFFFYPHDHFFTPPPIAQTKIKTSLSPFKNPTPKPHLLHQKRSLHAILLLSLSSLS